MKREFSSFKLKLTTFSFLLRFLLFRWGRINNLLVLMLRSKDLIKIFYHTRVCFLTVFIQWFKRYYSIVISVKASKCFQDMKTYFEKNWLMSRTRDYINKCSGLWEILWTETCSGPTHCSSLIQLVPLMKEEHTEFLGCWNESCNSNIQSLWTPKICSTLRVKTSGVKNEEQRTLKNVINIHENH